MNRSDFTALIAANPPVPPSSSSVVFQDHMQHAGPSSPNSPKLVFQSRVRNLKQHRVLPRPDFSTHQRRYSELEHVSSLRVSHKRSLSAQPTTQDTPNFWAEEREAWGHGSPGPSQSHQPSTESDVGSTQQPKQEPVLPPPRSQTRPIPQPRKQNRAQVPLRNFEPSQPLIDIDERPKTSRGPRQLEMLEEENEEEKQEVIEQEEEINEEEDTPSPSVSTNHAGRASKFLEGSMNDRSFGIASSWFQDVQPDSDKPLPLTPATKHVTFSCTPIRESVESQPADHPTITQKKQRKGLRRSISNFNFHSLSEKMKIFSGPTNNESASDTADKRKKDGQNPDAGIDVLNDRKRRADEAYAAQFGFKKQKVTTQPSPNTTGTSTSTATAPHPNIGQHSRSTEHIASQYSSNNNTKNKLRTSRSSTSITSPNPALRGLALPRKKTRRELERENAELRARLSARSVPHLPQYSPPAKQTSNDNGSTVGGGGAMFVRGNVVMVSPGKTKGVRGGVEDVPPVPRVPGRGVLSVLENGSLSERDSGEVGRSGGKKEDGRVNGVGRVKTMGGNGSGCIGAKESWEWPEDVF